MHGIQQSRRKALAEPGGALEQRDGVHPAVPHGAGVRAQAVAKAAGGLKDALAGVRPDACPVPQSPRNGVLADVEKPCDIRLGDAPGVVSA